MKGDRLGEFEEFTLLAVRALEQTAYSVPVQQYLEKATGRRVSLGAVYSALGRLEQKGLIRSALGEPTSERGGKRKRELAVTAAGWGFNKWRERRARRNPTYPGSATPDY